MSMRRSRRSRIEDLRLAIDCLPVRTRQAMLAGVRGNEIIVGAYSDRHGGVCPMLAAHRNGGRVTLLAFARSWDAFTNAKRVRKATPRELRTLEHLLVSSLEHETDFAQAIAEHLASKTRREYPEIRARRLTGSRRSGPRAAAGAAARTAW
jgi:hypothetical protein